MTIKESEWVFVRTPGKNQLKLIQITKGKLKLGKIGDLVDGSRLIGTSYGVTYEIIEGSKNFKKVNASLWEPESFLDEKEAGEDELAAEEEEDNNHLQITSQATNQFLNDKNDSQTLTSDEIAAFKQQNDISSSDLIKKIMDGSSTLSKKSTFSQIKYIKRKQAKYLKIFMVVKITPHLLCEYYTERESNKMNCLRTDSLAQILSNANLLPNSRALVIDEVQGLVCASTLYRGSKVFLLHRNDSFNANTALSKLNISKDCLNESLIAFPIDKINEDFNFTIESTPSAELRKMDKLNQLRKAQEILLQGKFDCLIVAASDYNPIQLFQSLLPMISYSRPIIFYSPYKEYLMPLFVFLRASEHVVNVSITECFLREFQVLTGRTRPVNTSTGCGGFILTATTVKNE